ncbi:helix-turn-helix domain-containing protein [Streptomyces sp. NBC_01242]|uniref:helix-turn-helix domain-containing protein n=1 Tax=Streptomyces sp. NBC_01242 TaxID=2903795 RepID=UPI002257E96C|nr:helix-turn-helix transcriptional regulator [Streptomyces sp. NBC_01242]MCX4799646.1 helix-turn-helix domain-containing protein [Streptomyces sp. NBC_01242]
MAYNGRPTIRRKILGRRLATAREAAGLTIEQVAAETSVSAATIYRQESGHVAVKPTMVPFFVKLYGIQDKAVEAQWDAWARIAKTKGPWAASGNIVGPSYRDYAEAEDMARELRTWQLGVIPGLLQTRNYSEEVIRAAATVRPGQLPSEDEEISALVKLRETRKAILERDDVPRIWAVIGEAAILTPPSVTDKDSHKEQVQHLLNLGDTKATIQVLPMDSGVHGCLSGSFSIITFDDLDLVFREGYGDGSFVDDEERVRSYQARFERLVMQALSHMDTRRYLHEVFSKM